MKRIIILSLISVTMFTYSMQSDNAEQIIQKIKSSKNKNEIINLINQTRDPKVIKFLVEDRAENFGNKRANPANMSGHWKMSYIAYAFTELKQGNSLLDVLYTGQEVAPTNVFHEIEFPFEIRAWDDKKIIPYFNLACNHWDKLKKSIESDWDLICAMFNTMNGKVTK